MVEALSDHRRHPRRVRSDERGHAWPLLQHADAVADLKLSPRAHPVPSLAACPHLPHHNPKRVNVRLQADARTVPHLRARYRRSHGVVIRVAVNRTQPVLVVANTQRVHG